MNVQECTPLIARGKEKPTQLPKVQVFILLSVQFLEPMTSQVIFPFINKLVSELPITGGDEAKVGYYAGLIESLFFATEALTVLQWSRWSDRIGRRPVLLTGLFGLSLSMVSFGLSKSYLALVVSRCLAGLLNGNIGVVKSMMGDLTDPSNVAQGMALITIAWSAGATAGSVIGGVLSNPYERFPRTFGQFEFWNHYPYALPCFAVACCCGLSFLLAYFCLEETVVQCSRKNADRHSEGRGIRAVLTPRVLIAVGNYAGISLLEIALCALQPLFYTTHIKHGGLGFTPPTVGIYLGVIAVACGINQAFLFSRIYSRFGTKRVFVTSMMSFIPIFALFPLMNLSARSELKGINGVTGAGLVIQMVLVMVTDMGFSCAFIYVRAAAPDDKSLGETNGFAQTTISVLRAIGPATSTSLFALSQDKQLLGGWFVYIVLIVISIIALFATTFLPSKLWDSDD